MYDQYSFFILRYQEVLYACGLEPDLQVLANGDKTEVRFNLNI